MNHHQIPVNAARCPVHSNHRDGAMRVDGNYGASPHYEPNSYGQWQEQPQYREPPMKIRGDADFWNFREDDADYFSQPGALFRSYNQAQKDRLFANTASRPGRCAGLHQAAPHRQLQQGRPGLRCRRRCGAEGAGQPAVGSVQAGAAGSGLPTATPAPKTSSSDRPASCTARRLRVGRRRRFNGPRRTFCTPNPNQGFRR